VRKLAAPLRLAWDWDWPRIAHPGAPPRRPSPEAVRTIGAEIVRAGVLLLEVGYPDAEALRSGELAAALAGFGGSLSLVLDPAAAAALAGFDAGRSLGAEEVWLDATPGAAPLPPALESWPAVRFYLTGGNAEAVAAGIERAVAAGAAAISLPNLPLFGELLRGPAAAPAATQLSAVAGRIAGALRGHAAVDLRIHHYGLWERLREAGVRPHGEADQGGGCQAGDALGYVDPAGVLHPCASLPVPLARVEAGALRLAWAGPELAALRAALGRLPGRCAGCPGEARCRGGCRGWAQYLTGTWDAPGPDCTRQ
jgi:radical SAM protein with 4Fe4S-binding SPASM domain